MIEGIRKQPNSSQLQGCLAGTGKCRGPGAVGVVEAGTAPAPSPDLPSEPSSPAVPSATGAARQCQGMPGPEPGNGSSLGQAVLCPARGQPRR